MKRAHPEARTVQREIAVGLDRRLRTTRTLLRGRMVEWAAQLEWWDPEEQGFTQNSFLALP